MTGIFRNLRVTSGGLSLAIHDPSVRAVIDGSRGDELELEFAYAGDPLELRKLASGELRRQVGIKLRALDGANVIYACWRWHPGPPAIQIQAKIAGEYLPPSETYLAAAVAAPELGARHTLRARLDNRIVRVWIDRAIVAVSELPEAALELGGPAGIRSDNATLIGLRISAS